MPVKSLMFTSHGPVTALQDQRARVLSAAFHAVMAMQLAMDAIDAGMESKEAYARVFNGMASHLIALHPSSSDAGEEILMIAEADGLTTIDWIPTQTEVLQ